MRRRVLYLAATSEAALALGILSFPGHAAANVNGSSVTTDIDPLNVSQGPPPAGFNVMTASPTELMQYGLPPRPSDASGLQQWQTAVDDVHQWVSPDPVAGPVRQIRPVTPGDNQADYGNWSGWGTPAVDNGDSSFYFEAVAAQWYQPSVPANKKYPDSDYPNGPAPVASFWVGEGSPQTGPLVQAGADSVSTKDAQYRFWTEDYPSPLINEGPVINGGDSLYVAVWMNLGGPGSAYYFLEDQTTGQASAFTNSAPYQDESWAEFINEWPSGSDYLPDFGSTTFSGCDEIYNDSTTTDGSLPLDDALGNGNFKISSDGTASGTLMSAPSAIQTSSDGFTVDWYAKN